MTRDEINCLLDNFSEVEMFAAEMYLLGILHRRNYAERDDHSMALFTKRREEFQRSVERRWRETVKSGTVSGMGGGGSIAYDRLGRASGEIAWQYSDGDTLVLEKLRVYANQEVQSIEKFSLSLRTRLNSYTCARLPAVAAHPAHRRHIHIRPRPRA